MQRIRLFRCSDVVVTVYTACRDDDQEFECHATDLCVPTHYICDGENHCGDWSDELYCSQSQVLIVLGYIVSGLSGLQSLSPIKTDSRCVVI